MDDPAAGRSKRKDKIDIDMDRAVPAQSAAWLSGDCMSPARVDCCAPIHAQEGLVREVSAFENIGRAKPLLGDQQTMQLPSIPNSREDGAVCSEGELLAASRSRAAVEVEKDPIENLACSKAPISDIGSLARFPGEVRNSIYRRAVLQPKQAPIQITMPRLTCAIGACLHASIGHNVPALAQTCAQLRFEVVSIFVGENPGFQFDAGSTYQS